MFLPKSKEKWTARLFVLLIVLHAAQTLFQAEDVVWEHCCLHSFASLIKFTSGVRPLDIASHVATIALRWVGHSLVHADASHLFSNLLLLAWVGPSLEHGHDDVLGEGVSKEGYKM
jgi:membrane associated rhomboid family serine protease